MPEAAVLAKEIERVLPLYRYVDKHGIQTVVQQGLAISIQNRLEITAVTDMGEAGGILFTIRHPNNKEVLTRSAGYFRFIDTGTVYDKIRA
ncbi:hypothetical protein ACYULU_15055 [Breznakiellaceae bacterium SP9]